jgi:hypothetical protein
MFAGSPPFEGTIGVAVRASEFRLFVKGAGENEFYDEVEAFPEAGTRFLVHDLGAGTTFARDAVGKANSLVVPTEYRPLARSEFNNAIGERAQEHVENNRLRRDLAAQARFGEGRVSTRLSHLPRRRPLAALRHSPAVCLQLKPSGPQVCRRPCFELTAQAYELQRKGVVKELLAMGEMQGTGNLLFAAYGPKWRKIAPHALGCSRRTVERYAAGQHLPPAVQRRLAATIARPEEIELWAMTEHERIDAIKAEWLAGASNLRTQLKQMAIEDERNPLRVGRPRKRRPVPRQLVIPLPAQVPGPLSAGKEETTTTAFPLLPTAPALSRAPQ